MIHEADNARLIEFTRSALDRKGRKASTPAIQLESVRILPVDVAPVVGTDRSGGSVK